MKKFTLFLYLIWIHQTIIAQTTILLEDFEQGVLPAGWTNISQATDGGWLFGTSNQLSSSYFSIPPHTKITATNDDKCNCDKGDEWLITPAMTFAGTANVFLSFDAFYYDGTYNNAKEKAYVKISTDGGTTWTTVFTLPGSSTWTTYDIDLSAYAGQTNVKIGFNYQDGGGWLFGWALDNVKVYQPAMGVDLAVSTVLVGKEDPRPVFVGFPKYVTGMPLTVLATVSNKGTQPITSFTIQWSDGSNTYSEVVNGVNILPLATYNHLFQQPFTTQAGNKTVTVTITSVNNGATEISGTNNSKTYSVFGVTPHPDRKYLAEEATGTWCGWCPRGTVYMDYMAETYPDQFVGVAVHNGDPMANSTYDNGVNNFPGFAGYPSVIVNRDYIIDPSQLESDFIDAIALAPAVRLSGEAEYAHADKKLKIKVTAEFLQNVSGDLRFNAIIIEDSVTGTSSGYKQANFYSGGAYGPMGGFENLPSSVPANQMHYNHVGRAILGGFDGTANSLPSSVKAGDKYSYEYTYLVPSTVKINNVHIGAMVIHYSGGKVALNSTKFNWIYSTGMETDPTTDLSMVLYPNPAVDQMWMNLQLPQAVPVTATLVNALGQQQLHFDWGTLSQHNVLSLDLQSLSPGIYLLQVQVGDKQLTQKLLLTK